MQPAKGKTDLVYFNWKQYLLSQKNENLLRKKQLYHHLKRKRQKNKVNKPCSFFGDDSLWNVMRCSCKMFQGFVNMYYCYISSFQTNLDEHRVINSGWGWKYPGRTVCLWMSRNQYFTLCFEFGQKIHYLKDLQILTACSF